MRRGEIWTVAERGHYSGKSRPAVIVQDDRFDATASVTVCGFTTTDVDIPLLRVQVEPDERNGLEVPSQVMVDKITSVRRDHLGTQVGQLSDTDMVLVNRALATFLGLAG